MQVPDPSALVRELRARSGESQRSFGARSGTSGSTVASYEAGRKEPRVSTLVRMAGGLGLELEIAVVDGTPAARARRRNRARALALAAAAAGEVRRDFGQAGALARENIDTMRDVVGDNAAAKWLDEWESLLSAGPDAVRAALLDPSGHGDDMRQMSPFAGLLGPAARAAALDVAAAIA